MRQSGGIVLPKDDVIEFEGVVVEALPNATFKVKLPNGYIITAHISGVEIQSQAPFGYLDGLSGYVDLFGSAHIVLRPLG